jgi:hypothetical protein
MNARLFLEAPELKGLWGHKAKKVTREIGDLKD